MKEGQQIRLSGQGQSGINGGANGDLYIEIQYKDTDRVHVEGSDIFDCRCSTMGSRIRARH